MGANFVSASSTSLTNSAAPITGYPFTVGCWANPGTVTGAQVIFDLAPSGGSSTNYYAVYRNGSTNFVFETNGGANGTSAGTPSANNWTYIIARGISATNRRLTILNPTGTVAHGADVASFTAAGVNALTLGNAPGAGIGFWQGVIAEFWYTATDIQADGLQLQDATMRQLAFGGPLSIPHISQDIIEYRSFRKTPTFDELGEVSYGASGIQTWANNGTVTTGVHPPLPGWYIRPNIPVSPFSVLLKSQIVFQGGSVAAAGYASPTLFMMGV